MKRKLDLLGFKGDPNSAMEIVLWCEERFIRRLGEKERNVLKEQFDLKSADYYQLIGCPAEAENVHFVVSLAIDAMYNRKRTFLRRLKLFKSFNFERDFVEIRD